MKEKLLFIISSLNTGGAQSSMANFSLALAEKYDIDWLLNSDENIVYEHSGSIISLGMHEPKDREALGYQLSAFVRRLFRLKRLKKTGQYKASISFLESANVANIITRTPGVRTIISQRNSDFERKSGIRRLVGSLEKGLYKKADSVVAISEGVRHELIRSYKLLPDKVTTIINGYDIARIKQLAASKPEGFERVPGSFTFVTTGRLKKIKGQHHLIRAFGRVVKMAEELDTVPRLVILGDGSKKGYLESLIHDLGLDANVEIIPYRKNPFAVLNACDAFVFPSLSEGFGNALCEALICGLPAIAADYRYGAREILSPKTDIENQTQDGFEEAHYGILVPVCSGSMYGADEPLEMQEEIMAKAMLYLMSDRELCDKYAAAAKERAKTLSLSTKAEEWSRVIAG